MKKFLSALIVGLLIPWAIVGLVNAQSTGVSEMGVFRYVLNTANSWIGLQTFTGGIQNTPGRAYLAANYTNATTTFSNVSLSLNVTNGRRYTFTYLLLASTDVAADGSKLDFAGGTATVTNFRATCLLSNAVGTGLTQTAATSAALATVLNIASFTDTNVHTYECFGSIEPSSTGTFIIRAAQNAHTTGTLTILRGSYLWLEDTP